MRKVLMLTAALCSAGCAGKPQGPTEVASYQPVVVPHDHQAVAGDYHINPLDQLRVDVFGEPELSLHDLTVDTNGFVILPMAGSIKVEGRTARELSGDIAERLNRYLRNPQVAVNVTAYTSQRITINGAVARPGLFDSPSRVSLQQAIAIAGGLSAEARPNEVLVFRTRDGQRYVARFDIGAIQAGLAEDPVIQPGDIIVVGYSQARRLLRDLLTVIPVALGVFYLLK